MLILLAFLLELFWYRNYRDIYSKRTNGEQNSRNDSDDDNNNVNRFNRKSDVIDMIGAIQLIRPRIYSYSHNHKCKLYWWLRPCNIFYAFNWCRFKLMWCQHFEFNKKNKMFTFQCISCIIVTSHTSIYPFLIV